MNLEVRKIEFLPQNNTLEIITFQQETTSPRDYSLVENVVTLPLSSKLMFPNGGCIKVVLLAHTTEK